MRRPTDVHRTVVAVLLLLLISWLLSVVLVPFALPPDTVDFGESGRSGIIEFEEERRAAGMTGYVWWVYWWGDANHHQKASRSYFLNGNQMSEDARDIGLYLGGIAGMALVIFRRVPFRGWWLMGGLLPMGLDGGVQLLTAYESQNELRVLTGVVGGFVLAALFGHMILEMVPSTRRTPIPTGSPTGAPPAPPPHAYPRKGWMQRVLSFPHRLSDGFRNRTPWDTAVIVLSVIASFVVLANIVAATSG